MSTISIFVLSLYIVSVLSIRNKLEVENCGGKNDVIQLTNIDINPMPITIPGDLRFSLNLRITRNLLSNIKLDLKLYRQTRVIFPIDVKIPCISKVGSCTYEVCPLLAKSNSGYTCPINAGVISETNRSVKIPKISGIISWLAKGDYKAEVRIRNETNHQLACFKGFFSLTRG